MALSNVPNVKTFYDSGDLKNQGQIKLIKCNKMAVSSVISDIHIKSLPQMVTNLYTFVCLIGYDGKIQLWPIKSRNEDAVT